MALPYATPPSRLAEAGDGTAEARSSRARRAAGLQQSCAVDAGAEESARTEARRGGACYARGASERTAGCGRWGHVGRRWDRDDSVGSQVETTGIIMIRSRATAAWPERPCGHGYQRVVWGRS